jgi:hypothetical protein
MSRPSPLPDFDTLVTLHQRDPVAFEALRNEVLRNAVNAAPARLRPALEHTLFRIEQAKDAAATPLESAASASKLMLESAGQLRSALDHLLHRTAALQTAIVLEKLRN